MASLRGLTARQLIALSSSPLYAVHVGDPVMLAALHLAIPDIGAVVVVDASGQFVTTVSRRDIFSLLEKYGWSWDALYRSEVVDLGSGAITVTQDEPLDTLIDRMVANRMGFASVLKDDSPTHMITLMDLAELYVNLGFVENLRNVNAMSLASTNVAKIDLSTTIPEAVRLMIGRNVRRLLVKDVNLIISDLTIIRWLLTYPTQEKFRRGIDVVLETPVAKIMAHSRMYFTPSIVKADIDAATALKTVIENPTHCALTEDFDPFLSLDDLGEFVDHTRPAPLVGGYRLL